MIALDSAEKELEDKELEFILDHWEDFVLYFIGFVVYLIFATCLVTL